MRVIAVSSGCKRDLATGREREGLLLVVASARTMWEPATAMLVQLHPVDGGAPEEQIAGES